MVEGVALLCNFELVSRAGDPRPLPTRALGKPEVNSKRHSADSSKCRIQKCF